MPNATPEPILQVAFGFMAAKHLFVANEVGLFEALAKGSLTLAALAERTVTPQRTTRIVADAMVALGFLHREGDRYRNGEAALTFLGGESGSGMRPLLRLMNRLSYPIWQGLDDAVRTDEARTHLGEFSAQDQEVYSAGVEALTAPVAQALPGAYDFGRHRRVLDLGGGTGSFLLAILQRYRGIAATLFDLPEVTSVARERLAGEEEGSRVALVGGDFFRDPLPPGHDAILLANVAHCFTRRHNLDLLRHIRRHVAEGARLLLVDLWTDPTHTLPEAAPLLAGEFLVMCGEGDVYSADEARGWLGDTGWRMIDHRPLAGPMSLILAETAP